MVSRKFLVRHKDSDFDVDYDSENGFEVFQFQLFSLTSVPPEEQKIYGEDGDRVVTGDDDLVSVSGKLRLVSISQERELSDQIAKADEEFARMLQAEEEALLLQQFSASEDTVPIEQKIRPYIDQVLKYEDIHRQEAARNSVPIDRLEERALVSLAKEGNFAPSKDEQDNAFLLQLLFWFKQSFRWVNAPPCDNCGNETVSHGMGLANSSETTHGASRVELYRCTACSGITRFPRYNDPLKLLETRKGRCGEWANCFTLYCRSFGYESRLILDFTDHVWTECYSSFLQRWIHLDPCEGIHDTPLLYEKGWNKKLSYIIAIAKDGVYDVTKRYTRKWQEVISRRNIITEHALHNVLLNLTNERRKTLSPEVVSALQERCRVELDELELCMVSKDDDSVSLPGRQSGDKEWRVLRSEFGSDSLSLSSCPVRKCIDQHVTRIYNAFLPIISRLVDQSSSKSKACGVFSIFRRILVDLKNAPYKKRRASVKLDQNDEKSLFYGIFPSFSQMMEALGLRSDIGANRKIDVFLASDPVKTSLALPVMFHALDDVMYNINQCGILAESSLAWPLLKLNRICAGFVLASGEELPSGIATSAFDGTRTTKWEEPNGARGCWIIYKVSDNQMHELVSYELMSANDAPERDPMDWVVEGSDDGGSSWRILDNRSSQIFENRFQRKTFEIKAQCFLSNAFRLRFLAVRDVQATSRFQIGSIDLYARSH